VNDKDIPMVVDQWLDSVDLNAVRDQCSSAYSGGMKRRLSLCLATIGNTQKFIILDEPTTGE
jgi:ABC-type multidrug transport system ATPase subunit